MSNQSYAIPLDQHILIVPSSEEMKSKFMNEMQQDKKNGPVTSSKEALIGAGKAVQNSKQTLIHTSETLKDSKKALKSSFASGIDLKSKEAYKNPKILLIEPKLFDIRKKNKKNTALIFDKQIGLKKISNNTKALRHANEKMNIMEETSKYSDVSFIDSKIISEEKDKKMINQITIEKKSINVKKKRVNNTHKTIENQKEILKNKENTLRKINEIQKDSKFIKQTQKSLDTMLIHFKHPSNVDNKTLIDLKGVYYPYNGPYTPGHYPYPPRYLPPLSGDYKPEVYGPVGQYNPGMYYPNNNAYLYQRRKQEVVGSVVALVLFCIAFIIVFALLTDWCKPRNNGCCAFTNML